MYLGYAHNKQKVKNSIVVYDIQSFTELSSYYNQ